MGSNIKILAIDKPKNSQDFLDFMQSHGFLNLITKGYTLLQDPFSLFDHIFNNLENPLSLWFYS